MANIGARMTIHPQSRDFFSSKEQLSITYLPGVPAFPKKKRDRKKKKKKGTGHLLGRVNVLIFNGLQVLGRFNEGNHKGCSPLFAGDCGVTAGS